MQTTEDEGARWLESVPDSGNLTEDTGGGKLRARERVKRTKGDK